MKTTLAFIVGVVALLSSPVLTRAAESPSVVAPQLKAGDLWVLDRSNQKGSSAFTRSRFDLTVDRVDSDAIVAGFKLDGSPSSPLESRIGLDWSNSLFLNGEQKTIDRKFRFPMKVGDSWTEDWTDSRRKGNQLSLHIHRTYKVVGWEDVTVPAGVFHALKIEANAVADAQIVVPSVATSAAMGQPGSSTAISHAQVGGKGVVHETILSAYYYVPDVKYYVKEFNEHYNSSNVMTERETDELVSFKAAS